MKIAGFQPLSLLDFPGQPCAIIFTQGCLFRCPYCHNPELIPHGPGTIDQALVLESLDKHANTVGAVCITGGEPTVQPDLPDFLRLLRLRGFKVKLDTNGVHPDMVERIVGDALVDYLAMDLKHTWEGYGKLVKMPEAGIKNVRRTFDLIQTSGVAHEFRTTICPGIHAEDELERMSGELAPHATWAWQPVRYGKTLDPDLPRGEALPLEALRLRLLERRPDLTIFIR